MKVFMLEVGGIPVLAVEAVDHREAHGALIDPGSAIDLLQFETTTGPVWDGKATCAFERRPEPKLLSTPRPKRGLTPIAPRGRMSAGLLSWNP